ncbi:hypothetical protein T265_06460 [Opisthorchis viverrini]|uniref:Uncharacterized protein n=1 Tax=Opisthorchis viverrini TaxID=6198 RepID=A0A074ZGD2_OPIVI|nr:hypothetical protein T265_06460 [Opisthorchis viverrini]KER26263.1 hypothetical protein T265_06460 [Opisthorchis viverrini]
MEYAHYGGLPTLAWTPWPGRMTYPAGSIHNNLNIHLKGLDMKWNTGWRAIRNHPCFAYAVMLECLADWCAAESSNRRTNEKYRLGNKPPVSTSSKRKMAANSAHKANPSVGAGAGHPVFLKLFRDKDAFQEIRTEKRQGLSQPCLRLLPRWHADTVTIQRSALTGNGDRICGIRSGNAPEDKGQDVTPNSRPSTTQQLRNTFTTSNSNPSVSTSYGDLIHITR